ncbi:MAG: tripartite tricarboxylate transporter TctB family protein [Oscillospiraceae bacterium]|nr:tripartite tricarboxylate transporter TctB family protein [Oscillospiraceae bacterium]
MKMKKTDIGVVVFMYLVCGFFYYHMTKLKASSQTYPRFTIILLFGLTTLYLVQMIVAAKKHGVESGVDEVFKDFQPAQFFVCLIAAILYLVCIYFFGFYISTVIFMLAVLLYLKVPVLYSAITVIVIVALIYFAFQRFLGVKLPVGTVMKALGK